MAAAAAVKNEYPPNRRVTDADMKRLEEHFSASKAKECFLKERDPELDWCGETAYEACKNPDILRRHAVYKDRAAVLPDWFHAAYPSCMVDMEDMKRIWEWAQATMHPDELAQVKAYFSPAGDKLDGCRWHASNIPHALSNKINMSPSALPDWFLYKYKYCL